MRNYCFHQQMVTGCCVAMNAGLIAPSRIRPIVT
jgi:hypothetical protein